MPQQSFNKNEKVKSRKTISILFSGRKALYAQNIKLLWEIGLRSDVYVEAGFAVPKRSVRKAVQRNYLKRLMREAFRKNREQLMLHLEERDLHVSMVFLYQATQILDYSSVESAVVQLLNELDRRLCN